MFTESSPDDVLLYLIFLCEIVSFVLFFFFKIYLFITHRERERERERGAEPQAEGEAGSMQGAR